MRKRWAAVVAAAALSLAACGGGGDGTTDTSPGGGSTATNGKESRTVSVGMLPILPTAALYAGIDQGFFAKHGLELKIETGQGGAALLPAVVSGQMEFATSNPVSLLQAREKGLDVVVFAHWTSSQTTDAEDSTAVLALADSGIKSAKDLAGKTVAVNTLAGMGGLTIREAVRKDGGDPDAVKFAELGFPDMPAALNQGNVDAVWVPEPFITILLGSGGHVVTYSSKDSVTGHPTQLFFTSGELAKKDPDLVKDMQAAVNEALEFADANPDAVRAAVSQVLEMDPALLAKVRMEQFGSDLRRDQVTRLGELMVEDGLLDKPADVDGLYWSP
jgi:NitT/TauT family transport system substrate-binding protein